MLGRPAENKKKDAKMRGSVQGERGANANHGQAVAHPLPTAHLICRGENGLNKVLAFCIAYILVRKREVV